MDIFHILVGFILLIFGKKLYWLLVGAIGFLVGMDIALFFLVGQPEMVVLLVAAAGGVV